MGSRVRRGWTIAGLVLGGGFLMAGPGTSCMSFIGETAATSLDTSFVFDCQNPVGGTFDFTTFLIDCAAQEEGP